MTVRPDVRAGQSRGTHHFVTDEPTGDRDRAPVLFSLTDLAAEPHPITDARIRLGHWIEQFPFGPARAYDIVLAVYEAMANVVEHAYASTSTPAMLDVLASFDAGRLEVTVIDRGIWSDTATGPLRGRGLPLIETLADVVTVSSAETGTTVTMAWSIDTGP